MRMVRPSSFEEFVRWYLSREYRKRNQDVDLCGRSDESLLKQMHRAEPGKLRSWFEGACWNIVSLDQISDALTLVCVDNWETRRHGLVCADGLDRQVMHVVVAVAREGRYFDNRHVVRTNSVEAHFRQERIDKYRKSWPELRDGERITICDLNLEERTQNPGGIFYLHDGFGRLLAYLYAIIYEGRDYRPIEAFLARDVGGAG